MDKHGKLERKQKKFAYNSTGKTENNTTKRLYIKFKKKFRKKLKNL